MEHQAVDPTSSSNGTGNGSSSTAHLDEQHQQQQKAASSFTSVEDALSTCNTLLAELKSLEAKAIHIHELAQTIQNEEAACLKQLSGQRKKVKDFLRQYSKHHTHLASLPSSLSSSTSTESPSTTSSTESFLKEERTNGKITGTRKDTKGSGSARSSVTLKSPDAVEALDEQVGSLRRKMQHLEMQFPRPAQ
ncbi:hypothetical protein HK102_000080 [Quaeritorhiza haematococci]|nr:hypothetical protein HK102_000080 [Quaeritorhiza haematococci]